MPLDFASQPTLNDKLLWLGINPVPDLVLEQHKQSEVAKHPGDRIYRYVGLLHWFIALSIILSLTSAVGGMMTGAISHNESLLWFGFLSGAVCLTIVTGICYVDVQQRNYPATDFGKFKGPATWRETLPVKIETLYQFTMPVEVKRIAVRAAAELPGASFIVGELTQAQKLLDPYLLIKVDGEVACLGVWDGNKVIHLAVTD